MFKIGSAVRPRILPYLMLFLICGTTALPLLGVQRRDSFPISTYPMFAKQRGQPTFHRLVAVFEDGSREAVPPELVASAEVLQMKVIVTRAVRRGKKAMRLLCQEVALKVSRSERFATTSELQLEEVRFDSIHYFTEAPKPVAAKTLMHCLVPMAERP